jgi:hypothetical protein
VIVESRAPCAEWPAELVKALADIGRLDRFTIMVADAYPVWHCICVFEDELLAFQHRNPYCGMTDGWRIEVGYADGLQDVPRYVGWGPVQAWLRYEDAACVVEPGYGLVCWDVREFYPKRNVVPIASTAVADDSAIHLNRMFRERREMEAAMGVGE